MNKSIIFVVCLLLSSLSYGQETWSLQKCISEAVGNSLEMQKAKLGVDFSDINVTQAKHNRYPSLSASSNLGLNFGRSINPITNLFETQSLFTNGFSINSGVTLFNGFRIANSLRQANIDREAFSYDVSQAERDIALSVANNYLSVLFAEENLTVANSQLDVSRDELKRTNQLIKAGSKPANDALDVEAQMATNEQAVIAAENNKTIAMLNLKQQIRIDINNDITLIKPEGVKIYHDPDELTFEEVYTQAYLNQPSIKAADLRKKSADLGVKIARAGLMPSIGAGANIETNYSKLPIDDNDTYTDQLDKNLSYGVGVSMDIPIYENYKNQLNVQRAKLNAIEIENNNAILENDLKVTVQQALTDARAAKRKLEATEKSHTALNAAADNAKKRYELGSINSFEYLSLQTKATEARVNALLAKYEYIFAMKVIDFYMGKTLTLD